MLNVTYYPPLLVIYLIVVCMSSSLVVLSPRSPPAPPLLRCLLIVDSICCRRQRCRRRHRGRCVGSSLAATAAEDDRVEVDDGVESLLSSASPPPPRQKIRGQKRAAEAPSIFSATAMVAGGTNDGFPWRWAGRQWCFAGLGLGAAFIKKFSSYCMNQKKPPRFFLFVSYRFLLTKYSNKLLVSTRSTLTTILESLLSRSSRTSSCSTGHRDTERLWPCVTLRVNKKRSHPLPPAGGRRHPRRCSSWGFLGIYPTPNRPAMR